MSQVGVESLNMRQAMKIMKEQAAAMAVRAQQEADGASAERAAADERLASANAALAQERAGIAALQVLSVDATDSGGACKSCGPQVAQ